jgi:hypothetical protein
VTRAAFGALSAAALLALGCGGGSPRVHLVRAAKPAWCPSVANMPSLMQHRGRLRDARHGDFDARRLVGLRLADAERLAKAHDCVVRTTRNGHNAFALTMDLEFDRIDVEVDHGIVTSLDMHNGPVG